MLKVNTVWYHYETNKKYRECGAWPDKPFYEFIETNAQRFPDKEAVIDSKWRLTYSQFVKMARRLALSFLEIGIGPGDVVAIQAPNWAELVLTEIACDYIDASFMALSDTWRESEISYLLNLAEVKAILIPYIYHGFNYFEMLTRLKPNLPHLEHIIVMGKEVPSGILSSNKMFETRIEEKYPADYLQRFRPVNGDAPRHFLTTSGTTGMPKISCWSTNGTYALFVHRIGGISIRMKEEDIMAGIAPANTAATGYGVGLLAPLCIGATAAILERWEPVEALKLMEREKCTVAVMIPTQAIKLLCEEVEKYDLSNFTTLWNGGAQFPAENIKEFEHRFHCKVLNGYGATDAGALCMVTVDDPEEKRWTTCGRVWDGELKIVIDEKGTEVPRGQEGEIWWRGPDSIYGYVNDLERDEASFTRDGFFKSGDVGFLDAEGYIHITGRIKDLIIRGGQNISPREIEELLAGHPKILDVAVAAMPDPVYGERACAFVVPKRGQSFTFEEMISFLEEKKIAKWKLPERLEILDELPKSAGAKVMKKDLTTMVTDKLKQEGKLPLDFQPQVKV